MSRTEISAVAGLSPATVSAISTSLLASGTLREAPGAAGKQGRGRPQVLLETNPAAGAVIALSLSVNGLETALVDYSGRTLSQRSKRVQALQMDSSHLLGCIETEVRNLLAQYDKNIPLRHITLGIQGVTNARLGRLLWSPIMREREVDFQKALSKAFSVPVTIDNDCNLIAEALRWSEDFPFRDDFVALLLGDGIGMGLYLGGTRFHGSKSSAGEFGHMVFEPLGRTCRCGAQGCIEAYAGDYAIIGAARPDLRERAIRGELPPNTFSQVADAARGGKAAARDAYRTAGMAIGSGLASLFSIIDPLPIAFVGNGSDALDLMLPTIREVLATTAVRNISSDLESLSFPDDKKLVLDGCSMTSLQHLDELFSSESSAGKIMEITE
jgi:predicted NBD/HSP70 family sugar kinase